MQKSDYWTQNGGLQMYQSIHCFQTHFFSQWTHVLYGDRNELLSILEILLPWSVFWRTTKQRPFHCDSLVTGVTTDEVQFFMTCCRLFLRCQ